MSIEEKDWRDMCGVERRPIHIFLKTLLIMMLGATLIYANYRYNMAKYDKVAKPFVTKVVSQLVQCESRVIQSCRDLDQFSTYLSKTDLERSFNSLKDLGASVEIGEPSLYYFHTRHPKLSYMDYIVPVKSNVGASNIILELHATENTFTVVNFDLVSKAPDTNDLQSYPFYFYMALLAGIIVFSIHYID